MASGFFCAHAGVKWDRSKGFRKAPRSAKFDWKLATKWRNSGDGSEFLILFRVNKSS